MSLKSQIAVLYEDDFLVAINKPPRMATVPDDNITLGQTALGKMQRLFEDQNIKPYVLHRLDFQTSGVLLFGKHEKDRPILEGILGHPDTQKKYIALTKGIPHGKVITRDIRARASAEKIPAQTIYKILKTFRGGPSSPQCALVEAEIKTGRRHQIRQHFAAIGHPIIMDPHYGDQHFNRKFRINFRLGRLFLHAASLIFTHPFLKKQIHVEAPLPMDLQSVLKKFVPR